MASYAGKTEKARLSPTFFLPGHMRALPELPEWGLGGVEDAPLLPVTTSLAVLHASPLPTAGTP